LHPYLFLVVARLRESVKGGGGRAWLRAIEGVFGWAVAFEKAVVGCDFLKSSCEEAKSSFGYTHVAFEKASP
jgi:hypothetical protein